MNSTTVKDGNSVLQYIFTTYFNWHAILSFVACVVAALILGRVVAYLLRRLVSRIGAMADKSTDLRRVNQLRRYETIIVISIAIIKVLLILFSLYFWWLLDHPDTQPTALIGASAILVLVLSASIGPLINDVSAGTAMMAEQWYGVGDFIKVEPFGDVQGVVERVTLRSTQIRNLNGEIVWLNNRTIQGVRITPKGIRRLALDLFVTDLDRGEQLVDIANARLPIGPLLLVSPLRISDELQVGENLWHITVIGKTAPGREWLIEKAAVDLIKELDDKSKTQVIAHGPLPRYADAEAEKEFKRTITNASKAVKTRKRIVRNTVPADTTAKYSKYQTIKNSRK